MTTQTADQVAKLQEKINSLQEEMNELDREWKAMNKQDMHSGTKGKIQRELERQFAVIQEYKYLTEDKMHELILRGETNG